MINAGSTKPGRVMKLVLTPLYLSETTKRQRQPTDRDGVPKSEERSKDELSQSEITSVGFTTSKRMRKRHFTSIGSTKTVKRQRQSLSKETKLQKTASIKKTPLITVK